MPKFWPTETRQECVNLSIEPTTLPNPSNPRVSQRLGFVWTSGSSAPCLSGQFDCSTVSFRALFTQSIVDCIGIVVHRYLPRWVEMKVRGEIRDLSYRVNIKFIGKNLSLVVFGYRMYDSKLCIISMLQDTCRAKIVVKPEHVVLPIEVGAGGSVGARKRRKLNKYSTWSSTVNYAQFQMKSTQTRILRKPLKPATFKCSLLPWFDNNLANPLSAPQSPRNFLGGSTPQVASGSRSFNFRAPAP